METLRKFVGLLLDAPGVLATNAAKLHRALGVASTPHSVVHQERTFRLLHFPPSPGKALGLAAAPPILFVPSLINRWYVLDLLPEHSTIRALADRGHSIYVLAWEGANDGHGPLTLADWVSRYVDRAVRLTTQHAGVETITVVGQCLGGTMALAHAARFPAHVDRVIALTTPVDFTQGGLLGTWTSPEVVDAERLATTWPGVVPDDVVYGAFPLLNPRTLLTRHRTLLAMVENDDFVRLYQALDLWTTEHLPVASGALRTLVADLYQQNALWEGKWVVGDGPVRLEDIRCPVLAVYAKGDDIVPEASAAALLDRIPQAQSFVSPAGHVTLVLGSPLRFQTWKAMHLFCLNTPPASSTPPAPSSPPQSSSPARPPSKGPTA